MPLEAYWSEAEAYMHSPDGPAPGEAFETFEIKGIRVAAISLSRAGELIGRFAANGSGGYVTVTGAHGIVESARDEEVREAHRHAALVVPDGMPLVWLGKLLGHRSMERVYGPDLMKQIFSTRELRKLRHFFYGSNPTVVGKLHQRLVARYGHFEMVGVYCPPMRPAGFDEDPAVIERIRRLKPDIVWVGLSTPKQELWLRKHMPMIGTGVGIGVGAAFDLLSGSIPQAPRWMQRAGMEWLFRLGVEPRRLFRRYLVVVPRFLIYLIQALLTQPPRKKSSRS